MLYLNNLSMLTSSDFVFENIKLRTYKVEFCFDSALLLCLESLSVITESKSDNCDENRMHLKMLIFTEMTECIHLELF